MSQNKDQLLCTDKCCMDDEVEHTLNCAKCLRKVHYRCTQLPAYQIQAIITTRLNKYLCQNCIQPTNELKEMIPTKQRSIPIFAVKEIDRLKREISGCESLIKKHQENETALQMKIEKQATALRDLKRKLQNNPAYHTLEYVEDTIENKLEHIKDTILETIRKEKEETENTIKDNIKTYASAITSKGEDNNTSPSNNINLHEVVRSVRKAELAEERNRSHRSKNVIIHGVPETIKDNENNDSNFVSTLIGDLYIKVTIKQVSRIGLTVEDKNRPIKIVLGCEEEKVKLMGNLSALRGIEKYKGISITEDLTQEERNTFKELARKANERNQQNPDDQHIWRVRGSSKNGFRLKKILRRKTFQA